MATGGSVLALLGENGAGKSTLMKILVGDYAPDSGRVTFDGHDITGATPLVAAAIGIRMVFQELSDAPPLTVTENICLGRWPTRRGRVDWRAAREQAVDSAGSVWGRTSTPTERVGSLRIGERQVVEIARALSGNARCLILDEPTAALSAGESDRLFEIIRRLRSAGVAIIYITHRLDEVQKIADRVQVLAGRRDGARRRCGRPRPGRHGGGDGRSAGGFDAAARDNRHWQRTSPRSSGFATWRPSERSPTSTWSCGPARSSPSTAGSVPGRKRSPKRSTAFATLPPGAIEIGRTGRLPMQWSGQRHPWWRRTAAWGSSA